MGLLGDSWDDPRTMATMQLAAGLLGGGNFGQALGRGLSGYQQTMQGAEQSKANELQRQMQMAQFEEYKRAAMDRHAMQEQEKARRAALAEIFQSGQPVDYQRMIASGMLKPEEAKALAEAPNLGRSEVARTVKGMDESGREVEYQVDKFGNRIGQGMAQYRAPMQVDTGGGVQFLDPYSLGGMGRLNKSMTPGEVASNQVARGQLGVAQGNLDLRRQELNQPNLSYVPDLGRMVNPKTGASQQVTDEQGNPVQPRVKLGETQQKQVTGINTLNNAIGEYLTQLEGWSKAKALSPDSRAEMGTKYQNMMLQAKEAFNLGVLNGPDAEILSKVITDPTDARALLISKSALLNQAKELRRMMADNAASIKGGQPAEQKPQKTVVQTGVYGGKRVTRYSDGSIEYAN